jgi:hypothetical protein
LFDLYLANIPEDERQVHNCHACRQFIRSFGGLVAIDVSGYKLPAMWQPQFAPPFYKNALLAMVEAIHKAPVTKPFLSAVQSWGSPITGVWEHFAVRNPSVFRHTLLTPGQAMAAKREDFATVARALYEFPPALLTEALRVLEADAVNRAEKFVGPVRWLIDLHTRRNATKFDRLRDNLLWCAIATAPAGYCHPRASVIGSLLEDIESGTPFEDIRRRFNEKVHGLRYQRPQAAPTAGNLAQAEKLVEKLGIATALERRFARLDEVQTIWKPKTVETNHQKDGVFSHLATKKAAPAVPSVRLPRVRMTWAKFAATVLPTADALEMLVPPHGDFQGMLTAANADAKPILKWDRDDARNPISTYVYNGGSSASSWALTSGILTPVTGIALRPNLWGNNPQLYLGEELTLILKGCVDQNEGQGNALFPETLRSELHEVRATIEAYSRHAKIGGKEEASACGYGIGKGDIGIDLCVTSAGSTADYRIDRWD